MKRKDKKKENETDPLDGSSQQSGSSQQQQIQQEQPRPQTAPASAQQQSGRGRGFARGKAVPALSADRNQQQIQPQQDVGGVWGRGRGRGYKKSTDGVQSLRDPNRNTPDVRLPQTQHQQQQRPVQRAQTPQQSLHQKSQQQQQQIQAETLQTLQEISTELSQISVGAQKKENLPEKLVVSSEQAQICYRQIPERKNLPGAGRAGRRIEVLTNMIQIKFGPKFPSEIIHYDVDIQPNTPKYLMREVFKAAKEKFFPNKNPAFDGKKNCYSTGKLPIQEREQFEVIVYNEDRREKRYTIKFQYANTIDVSWLKNIGPGVAERDQKSMQAIDIFLRNAAASRFTTVGRSFFTPPEGRVFSLGGGMDLWIGLFQSAVLGWKPYLNIDVAHKAFPTPEPVLDLMKTICRVTDQGQQDQRRDLQSHNRGPSQGGRQGHYQGRQGPTELTKDLIEQYKEDIKKYLKGLKVSYEIPGQGIQRTWRVNDLVKSPKEDIFEHKDKDDQIHKISVEQYYRLVKGYNIKYPDFPCLWVGNRDKNIHVPPELCKVVGGQAVQRKLDERQTSAMIKQAATGTEDRKKKIKEVFEKMHRQQDPCMKELDISVGGEFEKVQARVLDPPNLIYGQNKVQQVKKGVWRAVEFLNPSQEIGNDNSWTIVNLNRQTKQQDLYEFAKQLQYTGRTLGMSIGNPAIPLDTLQIGGNNIKELVGYFKYQKEKNIKLVVVVIPEMKNPYSKVKQISELNIGILTQCLKGKTLMKILQKDQATTVNIFLKINAKLNGVNHLFEANRSLPKCMQSPCMIVGADVTHPAPDAKDTPSIAAVVASSDPNAFKYNIEIRLQPSNQEIIEELTEIMCIQLKYFFKKSGGHKPEKIIYYRDGVSEDQFGQIMHAELTAIRNACKKMPGGDYRPRITFLVVQKRHHTRFFPTDKRNSDDRNMNVQAGTVVDTEITHPTHLDFYLVSHASIQGTARPTKYRCLWDDSDMSEDEIEQLTYFLCHMFTRCTRSVSYPTPTYYAHLAAFRARALTQDVYIDMSNLPREQQLKLTIKDAILKEKPMFFV